MNYHTCKNHSQELGRKETELAYLIHWYKSLPYANLATFVSPHRSCHHSARRNIRVEWRRAAHFKGVRIVLRLTAVCRSKRLWSNYDKYWYNRNMCKYVKSFIGREAFKICYSYKGTSRRLGEKGGKLSYPLELWVDANFFQAHRGHILYKA